MRELDVSETSAVSGGWLPLQEDDEVPPPPESPPENDDGPFIEEQEERLEDILGGSWNVEFDEDRGEYIGEREEEVILIG